MILLCNKGQRRSNSSNLQLSVISTLMRLKNDSPVPTMLQRNDVQKVR